MPKDQLQVLENVKEKIQEFKPKVKTLQSLSELKLVNPHTIEVGKTQIPLERTAVKGLCNILDMPQTFYAKLHAKNKQAWGTLTKMLSEQHRRAISLVAAKDRVIAIVESLADISKHDEVLDMIGMLLKHDKSYLIKHVEFDGVNLIIHLLHKVEFDIGNWRGLKNDFFRQGLLIKNSLVEGFEANSAIERMVCTNLAYAEVPGTGAAIYDVDKLLDFVDRRSTNDIIDRIKRKLIALKVVHASLDEILHVAGLFDTEDKSKAFTRKYVDQLRIGEIAWAYGMDLERLAKAPNLFRATIQTPFILYDVLNWVSQIAKQDSRLPTSDVLDMRMHAGKIIFTKPDALSIAPHKNISKNPWVLSDN